MVLGMLARYNASCLMFGELAAYPGGHTLAVVGLRAACRMLG